MRPRLTALAVTTTILLCVSLFARSDVMAQQKPASVRVYEVTSVEVVLEKSNPPNALVNAKGTVRTAGYTNARLVQVLYVTPPADGIQDLEFYADPPTGMVAQVISNIETPKLRIQHVPSWMKGVRVWAETNKIEKNF